MRSENAGPVDPTSSTEPSGADSTPDSFGLRTVDDGSTRTLRASGEIDILSAPTLRTALLPALSSAETVVLDLTGVTFLGSSGLAVLVEARDEAQKAGSRLRLVCSSRIVLRALEATGLRDLFDIVTEPSGGAAG